MIIITTERFHRRRLGTYKLSVFFKLPMLLSMLEKDKLLIALLAEIYSYTGRQASGIVIAIESIRTRGDGGPKWAFFRLLLY